MYKIGDRVVIRNTPAEIVCFLRRDNQTMYGVKMLSTLGQEFIMIARENEIDPPKPTVVFSSKLYVGHTFERSTYIRIEKFSDGNWTIKEVP